MFNCFDGMTYESRTKPMRFEALGGFCFPPHMAQMRSLQCADLEEMAGGGGVFGGWSAGYVALYVPVSQSISPVLKGGWWASHAGCPRGPPSTSSAGVSWSARAGSGKTGGKGTQSPGLAVVPAG